MNKWRRDPISSWQSFWKRGQLISRRSPLPSAEQPVLPAPRTVRLSSALLPPAEVSSWRDTSESCSLSADKSYGFTSCPTIFTCIGVWKKKMPFFANIFIFQPSHPFSSPSPGNIQSWGIQPKEIEIFWCRFTVTLGEGGWGVVGGGGREGSREVVFRICISTEKQK